MRSFILVSMLSASLLMATGACTSGLINPAGFGEPAAPPPPPPPADNVAPSAPYIAQINQPIKKNVTFTLPAFTDGNSDPLTYSVVGLPTGMTFNPTSRAITALINKSGTYTFQYKASDGKTQSEVTVVVKFS